MAPRKRTQLGLFATGSDLPLFTGAGGLKKPDKEFKPKARRAPAPPRPAQQLDLTRPTSATRSRTSKASSPRARAQLELPDRKLNEARKRRLLKKLDTALGRKPKPATATPAQKERRERAVSANRDARRSYDELKRAILAHGGIRANADYKRSEIPADLYRPRGQPADEMASYLADHGLHYEGDVEMFTDLNRRRDRVRDTTPPKLQRGPSIICMDIERDEHGRFRRHR